MLGATGPGDTQPGDTDAGPGYDEQAWRLLGSEMGLAGLGIAEDLGGVGGHNAAREILKDFRRRRF